MLLPFRNPTDAPEDGAVGLPEAAGESDAPRSRARRLRREKIQRLADEAAERWQEQHVVEEVLQPPAFYGPMLQSLPRPQGLDVVRSDESALPPPRPKDVFRAGLLNTSWRLCLWIYAALRFMSAVAWDKFLHRDTPATRARRLRHTFESMGPTFIKLGQQLSMRLDLLPYEFTRELERMLDDVPPMKFPVVQETIERTLERPMQEMFAAFDPNPVGSASMACVYRAVLVTGENVAVKVRRAGIGNTLVADMRALGWVLTFAELLYFRPGFTSNFLFELREMLLEELDFVREARFNELYRRRMRKTRQLRFASAPKIFFDYCSREVLTAEFLDGIFMKDILAALESEDEEALAKLDEMGIDPLILARRIQLIARYNNFENTFFHADIHPGNILVQEGNRILLIDFGSCGSFSRRELNSWRRWFDAQSVNDVGGMVQAALSILEPLPPIDRDAFGQRMETMFWNDLYAIKSKHSHWSERISARLWMGFLEISRIFHVPMRLNTLRMIRASMLADTIAARLDPDQDPYEEYRHYDKGAGRRSRRRIVKRLRQLCGPTKFVRFENAIESGLKLVYRVQRTVDSLSSIGIAPFIGKAAEITSFVIRTVGWWIALAGSWALWILIQNVRNGAPLSDRVFLHIFKDVVLNNGWYQIVALIPLLVYGRRVLLRLNDPDYSPARGDSRSVL